jgi:hypothetical protein
VLHIWWYSTGWLRYCTAHNSNITVVLLLDH